MTTQKITTPPRTIPYCFTEAEDAHVAALAVNKHFDFHGYAAYATATVLYVPEHPSRVKRMSIDTYVKSLGGQVYTS